MGLSPSSNNNGQDLDVAEAGIGTNKTPCEALGGIDTPSWSKNSSSRSDSNYLLQLHGQSAQKPCGAILQLSTRLDSPLGENQIAATDMLRVLISGKRSLVCSSLNLAHEMDSAEWHTDILLHSNKKWFIYFSDFGPQDHMLYFASKMPT